MKLRLQIATPPDGSTTFEHAGPVIRIGRDTSCELALGGEANRSVSSHHARIDLAADGAMLADTNSSNGTLLNDRAIEKPMPLRVGDRIQLGYTGPTLTVCELDLSVAADRPALAPRPLWIGIGAGVVAASVLVLGVVWLWPRNDRTPASSSPDIVQNSPKTEPPVKPPSSNSAKPSESGPERSEKSILSASDAKPVNPPSRGADAAKDALNTEVREVGRYVALEKSWPSVLLQRRGEAYPWTTLRPEGQVSTGHTLVSLPGCRSVIAQESGVFLTLWGNVPEFSGFPPVLESVVTLNLPESGVDLDLTLERGRVHLVQRKPSGSARIRLKFLREVWDLTLPESGSEVCAELWPQAASDAGRRISSISLGLFTKGRVLVRTPSQPLDLPDRSRLSWSSLAATLFPPEKLPQLPDWWTKPPDREAKAVADVLLSLLDWSNQLANSVEVVDKILTWVRDPTGDPKREDSTRRVLGVLFLAALDEVQGLVEFLDDARHSEVRGATREALRTWMSWNRDHPAELERLLQRRYSSKEKANLLVRLLDFLPKEDLERAESYQTLIGYLDHENLPVRDLAFWHLANLVPELAKQIRYDPQGTVEQRRQSIEQWRKLIPAGMVPIKLASRPGVR